MYNATSPFIKEIKIMSLLMLTMWLFLYLLLKITEQFVMPVEYISSEYV